MTVHKQSSDIRFPDEWADMNVVLCHDWLTGMRGGERVLEILCRGFPRAPILTLIHNPAAISDTINAHPIHVSWLQNIPAIMKHYRNWLPLFPAAVRSLRAPAADLMISTSHCVAKSVTPPPGARHLSYCFTPMRYAWTFFDEYFGNNALKAMAARPALGLLRAWDRKTSGTVDRFVAISEHVRDRIRRFYGKPADVVYPPVDTVRCTPGDRVDGDFDLVVSALVPYKRIDLAVAAYNQLGLPLKIAGVGSELTRFRAIANDNIEFLEWQSDARILELYRSCRMLIFPGEEDFGIVPLEAQCCGRPVVAYRNGGVTETVTDGVTGLFFDRQTPEDLIDAVRRCSAMHWDPAAIRANALRFETQAFVDGIAASIRKCIEHPH